ncbi:hypothetical protein J31TS3_27430 [Paenibacillus lactis]|nr:hypothetical protein J31TS3_27430 [Paenibacillus lactis]
MVNALDEDALILEDDSDVIKPYGRAFEALGQVRDSSNKDYKIEKGYSVTEIVGLTPRRSNPSTSSLGSILPQRRDSNQQTKCC